MKVILLLAIAIAAALVTQPMRASVLDLVITENSPTSLTATLDGTPLSVTNNGADAWFIALGGFSGTQTWLEPDGVGDNVVLGEPGALRISVRSDQSTVAFLGDGQTDTSDFGLNGFPISVTFFDKGDVVATAPDTGSTLGLLVLALTALLGTSRLRSFQLA